MKVVSLAVISLIIFASYPFPAASGYSGGPIFVWLFGYTGDVFVPEIQLGISPDMLVNVTKDLALNFGKDNLRIVTAVNQVQRRFISSGMVPVIKSYVDSLRQYASVIYGRIDLRIFNVTSARSVYDEVSLYVNQLDLNGIWLEKAAVYYAAVGQKTFNLMMENLTTTYPSLHFILNHAAVKYGIVTPLSGTRWPSMAWVSPSVAQNTSDHVNPLWIQKLNSIYPGHVVIHWDAYAKVAAQPMGIFASETEAQELADFGHVWKNASSLGAKVLIPAIGSWTYEGSQYGGTLYNSLQEGTFSRDTLPSFVQIAGGSPPGTSRLTVSTQGTDGAALTDYWAQLNQNGVTVAKGYTPASFSLNNGQTYTVEADGYGSCAFAYWLDTGSTNNQRTISITSDTSLIAVLECTS